MPHDVDSAIVPGVQSEAGQAIPVGGRRVERVALVIPSRQRETCGGPPSCQVGGPDPHLLMADLERQVVLGDGQQLAMTPAVLLHARCLQVQQINAWHEHPPALDHVHQRVASLVERGLDGDRPLTDGAARGVVIPPVPLGAEEFLRVEPIEAQVEPGGVDIAGGEAGRLVRVIRTEQAGQADLDRGIEIGGAEADGHLLPCLVAIRVGDVWPDAHFIVGAGLRAKVEHKGVVIGAEIGMDLGRGERRSHLQVVHHRVSINERVECDLKVGIGPGVLLAVVRVGADDAWQRSGVKVPLVSPSHPATARRAPHARVHTHHVGRVGGQPIGRGENECVPFHHHVTWDVPPSEKPQMESVLH